MTKHLSIFAVTFLTFVLPLAAQTEPVHQGVLCIGRLDVPKGIPGPMDRHGATTDSIFRIQVDKLPPVEVTQRHGAVVRNLDLATPHLVSIRLNGKVVESFRFRFSPQGPSELCLWYKAAYGYWSFMPDERRLLCSCRDDNKTKPEQETNSSPK